MQCFRFLISFVFILWFTSIDNSYILTEFPFRVSNDHICCSCLNSVICLDCKHSSAFYILYRSTASSFILFAYIVEPNLVARLSVCYQSYSVVIALSISFEPVWCFHIYTDLSPISLSPDKYLLLLLFRTWVIMDLHDLFSLVAHNNFWFFTMHCSPCSAISSHKCIQCTLFPFTTSLNLFFLIMGPK